LIYNVYIMNFGKVVSIGCRRLGLTELVFVFLFFFAGWVECISILSIL
jgi:hypothetical protein